PLRRRAPAPRRLWRGRAGRPRRRGRPLPRLQRRADQPLRLRSTLAAPESSWAAVSLHEHQPYETARAAQARRSKHMAETAAGILIDTMLDWGVEVVFGLPGDGINGIMEALRTRQDRIRFVQVRHEEAAAFMACGYAKTTGRLGVCLAT